MSNSTAINLITSWFLVFGIASATVIVFIEFLRLFRTAKTLVRKVQNHIYYSSEKATGNTPSESPTTVPNRGKTGVAISYYSMSERTRIIAHKLASKPLKIKCLILPPELHEGEESPSRCGFLVRSKRYTANTNIVKLDLVAVKEEKLKERIGIYFNGVHDHAKPLNRKSKRIINATNGYLRLCVILVSSDDYYIVGEHNGDDTTTLLPSLDVTVLEIDWAKFVGLGYDGFMTFYVMRRLDAVLGARILENLSLEDLHWEYFADNVASESYTATCRIALDLKASEFMSLFAPSAAFIREHEQIDVVRWKPVTENRLREILSPDLKNGIPSIKIHDGIAFALQVGNIVRL